MRNQFIKTIKKVFSENKKIFLILGDIGIYGFQDLLKKKHCKSIKYRNFRTSNGEFCRWTFEDRLYTYRSHDCDFYGRSCF